MLMVKPTDQSQGEAFVSFHDVVQFVKRVEYAQYQIDRDQPHDDCSEELFKDIEAVWRKLARFCHVLGVVIYSVHEKPVFGEGWTIRSYAFVKRLAESDEARRSQLLLEPPKCFKKVVFAVEDNSRQIDMG
ncbi:TPA: hypothetical protein DF272_04060 [Candidatus Falkowbacteria bacterium]|nr:hypothetical protein [Candidatus Falkowbacteria bacterium]